MTDPEDELILSALGLGKYAIRGTLMDAYGVYGNSLAASIEQWQRLSLVWSAQQIGFE